MVHPVQCVLFVLLASVGTFSCTDANVYVGPQSRLLAPDRLIVRGEICTEDTGGTGFPVKTLIGLDRSNDMAHIDPDYDSLSALQQFIDANNTAPHVSLGLLAIRDITTSVMGSDFLAVNDPAIATGIAGPMKNFSSQRNIGRALSKVESFVFADIARQEPGKVQRSRYLVHLLLGGPPSAGETAGELSAQVAGLKQRVYDAGVLEFSLNIGLIYYGPSSINRTTVDATGPVTTFNNCYTEDPTGTPCSCDTSVSGTGSYCQTYCDINSKKPIATEASMNKARDTYADLALSGDGVFTEFGCANNVDLRVGTATSAIELVRKDIIAFNRNVRLGSSGPMVDSDGDGISDLHELEADTPTDPTHWDSDRDGLGDGLEFRLYPSQDPNNAADRPASCIAVPQFYPGIDQDNDLLKDCEEGLIQTKSSVADSDGDGFSDLIEFLGGTIPISADDRLLDFDGDGVPNAAEITAHTNPQTYDTAYRGAESYHTSISSLGATEVPSMTNPSSLPGITFRRASPNVLPGQSYFKWDPTDNTLQWSDARFSGTPPFKPIPLVIASSGIHKLFAQSPNSEQIWIELDITLDFMPQVVTQINHPMSVSTRHCYDVRISNIRLMDTLAANGRTVRGRNEILVLFSQAPIQRRNAPGVTSMALIPVNFHCENDHCVRDPVDGELFLLDNMFVPLK